MADFNTEDKIMADLFKAKQDGLGKHFTPDMVKSTIHDYFFDDFIKQSERVRDLCILFEIPDSRSMEYIKACVDGFDSAVADVVKCHDKFVSDENKGDKQ